MGTAILADGAVVTWTMNKDGIFHIGTTAERLTAKLLKKHTAADAQLVVEAKLIDAGTSSGLL